jgi:competence protein ComEA
MFCLTHQERKVLLSIGLLILAGSIIRLVGAVDVADKPQALTSRPLQERSQVPLNINNASLKELQALPGIGEVTARRIIEYRSQCGSFADSEDLIKIKGIGDKKLEAIKKYIVF